MIQSLFEKILIVTIIQNIEIFQPKHLPLNQGILNATPMNEKRNICCKAVTQKKLDKDNDNCNNIVLKRKNKFSPQRISH